MTETDELRALFNEYAGEIRHLEGMSSMATVMETNTAVLTRANGMLDKVEPHIEAVAVAQTKAARTTELTEKAKAVLMEKVNPLHITLTVMLTFGLVYALLGYPMPRITDVVSP